MSVSKFFQYSSWSIHLMDFFLKLQIVIKVTRIITVKENVDQKTFTDLDGSQYHHFLLKLGYIMDLDRNCPITVQISFFFLYKSLESDTLAFSLTKFFMRNWCLGPSYLVKHFYDQVFFNEKLLKWQMMTWTLAWTKFTWLRNPLTKLTFNRAKEKSFLKILE